MRASYRRAIEWIGVNDDEDLAEDYGWLVSINLVADLFGKSSDEVGAAVKRWRKKHNF